MTEDDREAAWWALHDALARMRGWAAEPCRLFEVATAALRLPRSPIPGCPACYRRVR